MSKFASRASGVGFAEYLPADSGIGTKVEGGRHAGDGCVMGGEVVAGPGNIQEQHLGFYPVDGVVIGHDRLMNRQG
jgi:hypothetical protein